MKQLMILAAALFIFTSSFSQTTAKEWFDKGASLKKDEKYTEAITAFKKAAALDAKYPDVYYQLAWCCNEKEQYEDAVNALLKEEKLATPDASSRFEMGYAYRQLGKYEEALKYLDKTIALDAAYALAYKEKGIAQFKLKKYDAVLDNFDKYETLTTKDITSSYYYYVKGYVENEKEKYSDAVTALKKAVELDDAYDAAYAELAYSYYKLEDNDNALASYQKALKLVPDASNYLSGIGDVYFENLKDYAAAIPYYEKATVTNTTGQTLYYRLGWCYNDQEKYSKAVTTLKKAVELDPASASAKTELGYAYYKLDKYDDALSIFVPIMNSNKKSELTRYYAGFCYAQKNDQAKLKNMIAELEALSSTKYATTLKTYVK